MYVRYRGQVTKSKEHRGQSQRVLLEWDGSYKAELLLHFATLVWTLEPNRRNVDEISLLPLVPAPEGLDPRVKVVSTVEESIDRIYGPKSMNDMSKCFLKLTCLGKAEEIPRMLAREARKIFPLSGMMDEELQRMYALVFPERPPGLHLQVHDSLGALVSDFVDKLTQEKPSTPSIVVKTCGKFQGIK